NTQQSTGSSFGMVASFQSPTSASTTVAGSQSAPSGTAMMSSTLENKPLPPYEQQLTPHIQKYQNEFFALLDVSSNANQMGVSLGTPFPVRVKTGIAVGRGENVAHIEQTSNQMFGV